MPDSSAVSIKRDEVAREVEAAIVYVKDLDTSSDDVPEHLPLFRREDEAPTLDLDSLDALELGILFEERYGLGIGSDLDLSEDTTLSDLIDYLVVFLSEANNPLTRDLT